MLVFWRVPPGDDASCCGLVELEKKIASQQKTMGWLSSPRMGRFDLCSD